MEKIKDLVKKNKAVAIVLLIIVVLFAGLLVRRSFKKGAAPKTAKTKEVKLNADGTPVQKKAKKEKNAAATTPTTSTDTAAPTDATVNAQ